MYIVWIVSNILISLSFSIVELGAIADNVTELLKKMDRPKRKKLDFLEVKKAIANKEA